MSSLEEPCPNCGTEVYQLVSKSYYSHLKYYKEENSSDNDGNTGDEESLDRTTSPHAITDRGLLESILNTKLDTFEFNNENYEGWEEQQNSGSNECGLSECGLSEGSIEDEETHDMNSKKESVPLRRTYPFLGTYHFKLN